MDLVVEDVSMTIEDRLVLPMVSFTASSGSTVALTGPSGSGKTTLLNCIGLLLKPTAGGIRLDAQDTARLSLRTRLRFWRDRIAFVFQDYGLIDDETVGANVSLAQGSLWPRRHPRWSREVLRVLEEVGLPGRADDFVSKLSGGERQRVGIARALFKASPLVLADEPTASLDPANRRAIQDLLFLAAKRGATVVMATHDEELARKCEVVVTLGTGQTGLASNPTDLI